MGGPEPGPLRPPAGQQLFDYEAQEAPRRGAAAAHRGWESAEAGAANGATGLHRLPSDTIGGLLN